MRKIIMACLTAFLVMVGLSVASPARAALSCPTLSNGDWNYVGVGPHLVSICSEWEWAGSTNYWQIGQQGSRYLRFFAKDVPSGIYMTSRVMPGDRAVRDYGRQYPPEIHFFPYYILTSGQDYLRYDFQWRDPSNGKICRAFIWQDRYTFTEQNDWLPCTL